MLEPLPFTLRLPAENRWEAGNHRNSVYSVTGNLHLEQGVLVLEWVVEETANYVGFDRLGKEQQRYAPEVVEIPAEWIADVRVIDLYVVTWITLRGRRLDTFDGIPSAKPGLLTLVVSGTHRRTMKALVVALEKARHAAPFRAPDPTRVLPPAAEEQTPLP